MSAERFIATRASFGTIGRRRRQLDNFSATPPAEIASQHGQRDWKPPTGVRAPKRIPPGPREKSHAPVAVARPASTPVAFVARLGGTVMLG